LCFIQSIHLLLQLRVFNSLGVLFVDLIGEYMTRDGLWLDKRHVEISLYLDVIL
jgi:hypothetical protein